MAIPRSTPGSVSRRLSAGIDIGPGLHRTRGEKDETVAAKALAAIRGRGALRPAASAGPGRSARCRAPEGLQGEIAATTKRGSGPVRACAAAIGHIVRDGPYAQVPRRRGLTHEAVTRSETDPNGLPLPGSRAPRDPRENT
ncbi:hypothetical protein ACFVZJ_32585 [Streptomyces sp. NPDC058322]|uniref:hypothetical protein n=1 Tax=unclassified Streptomyces TaxID=2593676 RepID=UPI0036E6BFC7